MTRSAILDALGAALLGGVLVWAAWFAVDRHIAWVEARDRAAWEAIRSGRCPWQETPCVCGSGSVGDYDGPLADCPTHGDFHRVLG